MGCNDRECPMGCGKIPHDGPCNRSVWCNCHHAAHPGHLCPVCKCDVGFGLAPAVPELVEAPREDVNHPQHYGGDVPHEHYKCMIGSGLVRDGFLYNCTKYLWRVGKKPGETALRDLGKALWYLQRRIEQEGGVIEVQGVPKGEGMTLRLGVRKR